eukprot:Rmarinus@m.27875
MGDPGGGSHRLQRLSNTQAIRRCTPYDVPAPRMQVSWGAALGYDGPSQEDPIPGKQSYSPISGTREGHVGPFRWHSDGAIPTSAGNSPLSRDWMPRMPSEPTRDPAATEVSDFLARAQNIVQNRQIAEPSLVGPELLSQSLWVLGEAEKHLARFRPLMSGWVLVRRPMDISQGGEPSARVFASLTPCSMELFDSPEEMNLLQDIPIHGCNVSIYQELENSSLYYVALEARLSGFAARSEGLKWGNDETNRINFALTARDEALRWRESIHSVVSSLDSELMKIRAGISSTTPSRLPRVPTHPRGLHSTMSNIMKPPSPKSESHSLGRDNASVSEDVGDRSHDMEVDSAPRRWLSAPEPSFSVFGPSFPPHKAPPNFRQTLSTPFASSRLAMTPENGRGGSTVSSGISSKGDEMGSDTGSLPSRFPSSHSAASTDGITRRLGDTAGSGPGAAVVPPPVTAHDILSGRFGSGFGSSPTHAAALAFPFGGGPGPHLSLPTPPSTAFPANGGVRRSGSSSGGSLGGFEALTSAWSPFADTGATPHYAPKRFASAPTPSAPRSNPPSGSPFAGRIGTGASSSASSSTSGLGGDRMVFWQRMAAAGASPTSSDGNLSAVQGAHPSPFSRTAVGGPNGGSGSGGVDESQGSSKGAFRIPEYPSKYQKGSGMSAASPHEPSVSAKAGNSAAIAGTAGARSLEGLDPSERTAAEILMGGIG